MKPPAVLGLAWIPLRAKTVQGTLGLDCQWLLHVETLRTLPHLADAPHWVPELRVLCECCDFPLPALLWAFQIWFNNYTPLECASWYWLVLTAQFSENQCTWLYKWMTLWEYLWLGLLWFDQKDIICLQLSISDHPKAWGLCISERMEITCNLTSREVGLQQHGVLVIISHAHIYSYSRRWRHYPNFILMSI